MLSNAMDEPEFNEDGIEITLVVNHLGHFLLTHNLLDLLKRSGPGSRIVSVAGGGYEWANPTAFRNLDALKLDGAADYEPSERATIIPSANDFIYHVFRPVWSSSMTRYFNSKLANVLFTMELAKRTKPTGVTAYSVHPGAILSEIGVDRITGVDIFGTNHTAYNEIAAHIPDFIQPLSFAFKNVEEGAQTSICCAVGDQYKDQSGLYYSDCTAKEVLRLELNGEFTAKFWDWSFHIIREVHPIMSPAMTSN